MGAGAPGAGRGGAGSHLRGSSGGAGREQVLTDSSQVYLYKWPRFGIQGLWELGSRGSGGQREQRGSRERGWGEQVLTDNSLVYLYKLHHFGIRDRFQRILHTHSRPLHTSGPVTNHIQDIIFLFRPLFLGGTAK